MKVTTWRCVLLKEVNICERVKARNSSFRYKVKKKPESEKG